MNGKTDRASEIMKQMEFIEQLTQKLNRTIYLSAQTAIGKKRYGRIYSGTVRHKAAQA